MTTRPVALELPSPVVTAIASQVEAASQVQPSFPSGFTPNYSDPDYKVRQWFLDQLPGEQGGRGTISRADLTREGGALTPDSSDEELRAFLLLVNGWGFGSSGYGPWRTRQVLDSGRFPNSARKAIELLHGDAPDAALRAYFHLNNRAHGRVSWWGPAFFTKFIAFADPANSSDLTNRQGALILDRWMATAVRHIASHSEFPLGGWTTPQYAYYLTLMSRLSESTTLRGAASPVAAERALFAWYAGR